MCNEKDKNKTENDEIFDFYDLLGQGVKKCREKTDAEKEKVPEQEPDENARNYRDHFDDFL